MEENVLPKHLGFIVDGNRRWARERGLPTLEGHRRGIDLVADIAEECHKQGVKIVSFYIFSTENWNRSKEEVDYLMDLVEKCLKKFIKKCLKNDTRIAILGTKERLSQNLVKAVEEAEEKTKHCPFCENQDLILTRPMLRPWGFAPKNGESISSAQRITR